MSPHPRRPSSVRRERPDLQLRDAGGAMSPVRYNQGPKRWQEEGTTRQGRETHAARGRAARNLAAGRVASPSRKPGAREARRPNRRAAARETPRERVKGRARLRMSAPGMRARKRRRNSTPTTNRNLPASTSSSSSSRSGSSTRASRSSQSSKAGMQRARAGSSSASASASTRGCAGWWRSAHRPNGRRRSGTSSATSPTCRRRAKWCSSTGAGTTAPGWSG